MRPNCSPGSRSATRGAIILVLAVTAGPAISQGTDTRQPPVPLSGLTTEERARFEEGRRLFEFEFAPRDGLGPLFNARACAACHHIPTIGGHGPGYRSNLRYRDGHETHGRLFHDKAIGGMPVPALPQGAVISKRKPPSLLGLGLIAAIPEEAILAHADPEDRNGDGISGRPAIGRDGHLMRFGSQAHIGSLVEFVADALRQELGLTSPIPGFEEETVPLPFPARPRLQQVPSPNVTLEPCGRSWTSSRCWHRRLAGQASSARQDRPAARGCSETSPARLVTSPRSAPAADPPRVRISRSRLQSARCWIRTSRPTPTFSCTTWGRRWTTRSH